MSKTFKIGVYEEQSGAVKVVANNLKEAEDYVLTLLEEEGLEGLENFKIMDRSYGVTDSEEI
jgi:hypothetical protein